MSDATEEKPRTERDLQREEADQAVIWLQKTVKRALLVVGSLLLLWILLQVLDVLRA